MTTRTAAEVWLKYARDLNVREAEHALAGIDAEMARLRAELDQVRKILADRENEITRHRAHEFYLDGLVEDARAAIKAGKEK